VSFFPGKNLGALGDAGMVLTQDQFLAEAVRMLRNQGCKEKYMHEVRGYNHRMDSLQAAVLKVKLPHLDGWNARRRENAQYYNEQFSGLPVETPYVPAENHARLPPLRPAGGPSSAALIEYLKNKGIDARVYYPLPLHLQKCFAYLGHKEGEIPRIGKGEPRDTRDPGAPGPFADERAISPPPSRSIFVGQGTHKLSVVVLTKNESARIERCLASVTWADEVIVVDR